MELSSFIFSHLVFSRIFQSIFLPLQKPIVAAILRGIKIKENINKNILEIGHEDRIPQDL